MSVKRNVTSPLGSSSLADTGEPPPPGSRHHPAAHRQPPAIGETAWVGRLQGRVRFLNDETRASLRPARADNDGKRGLHGAPGPRRFRDTRQMGLGDKGDKAGKAELEETVLTDRVGP